MIVSKYGKLFLDYYNQKNNCAITPKEFVTDKLLPFLYNGKRLMFVMNSIFTNPSNKKYSFDAKLKMFVEGVENGACDASIVIGGFAKGFDATTSFNVALDYIPKYSKDDVYLSWIGGALSVSLDTNNIQFLINSPEILYDIYTGWERLNVLNNDPIYKDFSENQINTYNGLWLNYLAKKSKRPSTPEFNPYIDSAIKKGDSSSLINTSWISLLFNLGNRYNYDMVNAYVFRYVRDNFTYGNVSIYLKKMSNIIEYFRSNFEGYDYLSTLENYEKVVGRNSLDAICRYGVIGLIPLKPEILRLEEKSYSKDADKNKCYNNINAYDQKFINLYIMSKLKFTDDQLDSIVKGLHTFKDSPSTKSSGTKIIEELWNAGNNLKVVSVLTKFAEYIGNGIEKETILSIEALFKSEKVIDYREIIAVLKYKYIMFNK